MTEDLTPLEAKQRPQTAFLVEAVEPDPDRPHSWRVVQRGPFPGMPAATQSAVELAQQNSRISEIHIRGCRVEEPTEQDADG